MPPFRNRPSRRRERGLKAQCLVLGTPATPILHEGRTAHLLPVKSGDHRSRFAVGQRLSVKVMVPGPTACNVILFDVKGPRDLFALGEVDRQTAKDLGHVRLDAFWRHWITNHDQEWLGRAMEAGEDTEDEIARRFDTRWSGKLAWLLRFTIDNAAEPRLLAARSDELYVSSEAMALKGELPALSVVEWETHIGPKSPYRIADRVASKRSETWQSRYATAKASAREAGKDIRSECRRFDLLMSQGKTEKAMRQLDLIEARLFPVAA